MASSRKKVGTLAKPVVGDDSADTEQNQRIGSKLVSGKVFQQFNALVSGKKTLEDIFETESVANDGTLNFFKDDIEACKRALNTLEIGLKQRAEQIAEEKQKEEVKRQQEEKEEGEKETERQADTVQGEGGFNATPVNQPTSQDLPQRTAFQVPSGAYENFQCQQPKPAIFAQALYDILERADEFRAHNDGKLSRDTLSQLIYGNNFDKLDRPSQTNFFQQARHMSANLIMLLTGTPAGEYNNKTIEALDASVEQDRYIAQPTESGSLSSVFEKKFKAVRLKSKSEDDSDSNMEGTASGASTGKRRSLESSPPLPQQSPTSDPNYPPQFSAFNPAPPTFPSSAPVQSSLAYSSPAYSSPQPSTVLPNETIATGILAGIPDNIADTDAFNVWFEDEIAAGWENALKTDTRLTGKTVADLRDIEAQTAHFLGQRNQIYATALQNIMTDLPNINKNLKEMIVQFKPETEQELRSLFVTYANTLTKDTTDEEIAEEVGRTNKSLPQFSSAYIQFLIGLREKMRSEQTLHLSPPRTSGDTGDLGELDGGDAVNQHSISGGAGSGRDATKTIDTDVIAQEIIGQLKTEAPERRLLSTAVSQIRDLTDYSAEVKRDIETRVIKGFKKIMEPQDLINLIEESIKLGRESVDAIADFMAPTIQSIEGDQSLTTDEKKKKIGTFKQAVLAWAKTYSPPKSMSTSPNTAASAPLPFADIYKTRELTKEEIQAFNGLKTQWSNALKRKTTPGAAAASRPDKKATRELSAAASEFSPEDQIALWAEQLWNSSPEDYVAAYKKKVTDPADMKQLYTSQKINYGKNKMAIETILGPRVKQAIEDAAQTEGVPQRGAATRRRRQGGRSVHKNPLLSQYQELWNETDSGSETESGTESDTDSESNSETDTDTASDDSY